MPQTQQSDRILRLRQVMDKTGLSKTSVYRLSGDADSDFPESVRLTEKTVGWRESAVDAWVNSRKVVA